MGRAIGLEVKKCLEWKALKEPKQEEDDEVKEEEMETEYHHTVVIKEWPDVAQDLLCLNYFVMTSNHWNAGENTSMQGT
jgi:hypothetical protein